MAKVTNIKFAKTEIKLTADQKKKYASLIPSFVEETVEFNLINAGPEVANALRRTAINELQVKALYFEPEAFKTDLPKELEKTGLSYDPYQYYDMILRRIQAIPINQNISTLARFTLLATNTTTDIRNVLSNEIKTKGSVPFSKTINITDLTPGKFTHIEPIIVKEGFGYEDIIYSIVSRVESNAIHKGTKKLPATMEYATEHRMKFHTFGTIQTKTLLPLICDSIIDRLDIILKEIITASDQVKKSSAVDHISKYYATPILEIRYEDNDKMVMTIYNESHTIGRIFENGTHLVFPKIQNVSAESPDPENRVLIITIVHTNPLLILKDVADKYIKIFTSIKKQF
jgi:hypothetical protein